jgi:hypothetical protein
MTQSDLVINLKRIRCWTTPDSMARKLLTELIQALGGK